MEPFIGEIRVFAGIFIPNGYFLCAGQTLSVSVYPALASIIGNKFGGDGKNTFMLPKLLGYAISGPGASGGNEPVRTYATPYGVTTNTITSADIPAHTHTWQAKATTGFGQRDATPTGNYLGGFAIGPSPGTSINSLSAGVTPDTTLSPLAVVPFGGGTQNPIDNEQPYIYLGFGIAWEGVYPPKP